MAQLKNTTVSSALTVKGNTTITNTLAVNGTDVKTKLNLIDTINSKLTNLLNAYTLTVTCSAGSNYTVSDYSATLIGNLLCVYFAASRKSATSGDISNETVCIITAQTGGKIKSCMNNATVSGSSGGNASFYTDITTASTSIAIKIIATAYAQSTSSTNGRFIIPVALDISKY